MPRPTFRLPRPIARLAVAIACLGVAPLSHAVGQRVDVQLVDRSTGETLTPILHDGAWWVAGRPGARYRIALVNRDGRRTLNVVSVDGVNAMSGDTASWDQSGYVLSPYERTDVDGWRKNMEQVAAFQFASLPDSYAARTGRPANVGVIGIAVFDEQRVLAHTNGVGGAPGTARRLAIPSDPAPSADEPSPSPAAPTGSAVPAPPPPARAEAPKADAMSVQRERLGTAHGEIESSAIRWVSFRRAQSTPDEIVTIHYDRIENLVAMGIVPRPLPPIAANPASTAAANPFPGSQRFVPDPPPRD